MTHKLIRWILVALLWGASLAMAQSAEPTIKDIYAAAESGRLSQAQSMIQQVLVAHPNSAKAHYVESELFARQGNLGRAREALSTAEKIEPGLPFAKPQALQALRNQLYPNSASPAPAMRMTTQAPPAPPTSGNNWLLPLVLAGGLITVVYFVFRQRRTDAYAMGGANALSGPQNFGGGGAVQPTYGPSPYGANPYAQPYGAAPSSGLGGRIMGGVATGLAVGAGVMAAEAIGRNLMGERESGSRLDNGYGNDNRYEPANTNPDMGGQDFGINDTSSWDDGGSSSMGGGSDWDN